MDRFQFTTAVFRMLLSVRLIAGFDWPNRILCRRYPTRCAITRCGRWSAVV
ncbi:hypothetical protein SAOR_04800 [Salinisphaera orenii MK-B5]|uniref:Uncharacterized protein n=1 Tax=Salinisphaera orenii MK-B5 TaxID=856730 RepID=A0A423PTF3_9GAMM|nr:hypothetical protein SAOR_04800 [Salinisphaera orenii MK-B5]